MIFMSILIGFGCNGYQFDPIKNKLGAFVSNLKEAYISHTSWRLLYYYDLSYFYDNINTFRESLDKMNQICDALSEQGEDSQCSTIISQHNNFLDEINIDIEYLQTMQKDIKNDEQIVRRRKRQAVFGSIGTYIYKPLFGIMDEKDAELIINKINSIVDKQNAHHTILEDNLSIIQRTIEATNDSMAEFKSSMKEMNAFATNTLKQLKIMEENLNLQINFNTFSTITNNIKFEYTKAINLIKRVLRNKLYGEYTELITYQRVIQDLMVVSQELDDTKVSLISKPSELQQSISVLGTLMDKKLLIQLDIPMVDRDIYSLMRVIPLPIRTADKVMILQIPHYEYLVNNDTGVYIPLDAMDLSLCRNIAHSKLLCFPQRETHLADNLACESNILFSRSHDLLEKFCRFSTIENKNYIIRLGDNLHFISPRASTAIKENCLRELPTDSVIGQVGILNLDANCDITIDKKILFSKYVRTRSGINNLPISNRTTVIKIKNIKSLSKKLDGLSDQPRTVVMNFNERFAPLKNDTARLIEITQRIGKEGKIDREFREELIYGTIILIVLLVLYIINRKCCSKN